MYALDVNFQGLTIPKINHSENLIIYVKHEFSEHFHVMQ